MTKTNAKTDLTPAFERKHYDRLKSREVVERAVETMTEHGLQYVSNPAATAKTRTPIGPERQHRVRVMTDAITLINLYATLGSALAKAQLVPD